ncbi:MAG: glycoside hydrolase family 78 protein [Actinobacteria bacterium]|nr:glycoside hydrolase family 78 protein [Actinomycetota bacterium]
MSTSTPQMITPIVDDEAAPLLRRTFDVDAAHGRPTRAVLRLAARGLIEAWIDGVPTSDELLNPGWTSYEWRTRVIEHDVTALVGDRSTLALRLGNGWYRGYLGFTGQRALYGDDRGGWAHLELTFADGHRQSIVTDETWRASTGAVRSDDFYRGQMIDARIDDEAWKHPEFDDAGWVGVRVLPPDGAELVERTSPPVRRLAKVAPMSMTTTASGATLVDFGQNLVGVVRLSVRGQIGTTVVVRHAEVLEHGELATAPLRAATSTDTYVLSGGDDVFEPTLTFHGFRYAEIAGLASPPRLEDVTAIVIGTDIPITATFECSDPELNRLHENVIWGMRGNFLSVPTDCPQRDERLGWTGDLSAFAPTAAYLGDVESFLTDWLTDLALEQRSSGAVPVVVPDALKYCDTGFPTPGATAIWGDAAIWVPWELWIATGHRTVLERAYPSMSAHLASIAEALTGDVWSHGFQFGDWLDPDAPDDDPGKSKADTGVVSTLCALRDASLMERTANVLGRTEDAAAFSALRDRIRAGFQREYWFDGRIISDCATVYALAIEFDALDVAQRVTAGERLTELMRANDFRISTGFAGTPFLLAALTSTGHLDIAYRVLLNPEIPGWIFPVRAGATTIWERWDSMRPDGTVNPNGMTSFNHYAFGAVADWLHRTVGGLSPLDAGYATALVAPRPGGGLTHASTSTVTPYGRLSVSWEIVAGSFHADVVIPPGMTAVLRLPGLQEEIVAAGEHRRESGAR